MEAVTLLIQRMGPLPSPECQKSAFSSHHHVGVATEDCLNHLLV